MMAAEVTAAVGRTPSSFDITAIPAMIQREPGRYLPKLERIQIRAATRKLRAWSYPARTLRQLSMRTAYVAVAARRASARPRGANCHSTGWALSAFH